MRRLKINLARLGAKERSVYSSLYWGELPDGKLLSKLTRKLDYSNKYSIVIYDSEDRTLEVGDKLVFDWMGKDKIEDIRYGEVISIKGNDVMVLNQYGNYSKMNLDPTNENFPNQKWYKLIYTTDKTMCDKKFPNTFINVYKNKYKDIKEVLVEENGEFLNFKKV